MLQQKGNTTLEKECTFWDQTSLGSNFGCLPTTGELVNPWTCFSSVKWVTIILVLLECWNDSYISLVWWLLFQSWLWGYLCMIISAMIEGHSLSLSFPLHDQVSLAGAWSSRPWIHTHSSRSWHRRSVHHAWTSTALHSAHSHTSLLEKPKIAVITDDDVGQIYIIKVTLLTWIRGFVEISSTH